MNKYLKIGAVLTLSLLLLSGCTGKDATSGNEAENNSSTSSQTTSDQSSSVNEDKSSQEKDPSSDVVYSEDDLTGEQEYSFENISLKYDADTIAVAQQGTGNEFMVSLYGKNGETVVPRIDILGMDTSSLEEAITKEQFEELATQLVTEYYGEDAASVTMVPSSTELSMDDPSNRSASTIVNVTATEEVPSIYAEVSMKYNEESGAIALLLLNADATGDESAPFMMAFESIKVGS